ncbi:hypothetical protein [Pararhizobium sp.]|uniref:hypothetical protein n=1 Tax=Pararhizobium sp. TaxID=1977563 RepID=UPI00271CDE25|nr:hypothetical protein [Pararhizobium sp.]MDO9415821.1 hypothetical protein [Pararhizobium sp.]
MTDFDKIPNKELVEFKEAATAFWPEHGNNFELNKFYGLFKSAEGWLGRSYVSFWSRSEIESFRASNFEAYPEKYWFFASDRGGTQFGFFPEDGNILYISAPDIGEENDIRVLGDWDHFLSMLDSGEYI